MTTRNGSSLFVVDSSGWVDYMAEGAKAEKYSAYIQQEQALLLPTIALYEVYKKLLITRGESLAERFHSHALRTQVVSLDERLALAAVAASIEHRLAMADAIIYATAHAYQAQLVTSDTHFQRLPGVTLI